MTDVSITISKIRMWKRVVDYSYKYFIGINLSAEILHFEVSYISKSVKRNYNTEGNSFNVSCNL